MSPGAKDFSGRSTARQRLVKALWQTGWCVLVLLACRSVIAAEKPHYYVFFNRDRERISESTFLNTRAIEGAQIKYTWRQLERGKDGYDFADIRQDLAFLNSKGKKLFVQLQDVSFDPSIVPLPRYLLNDPEYHGGADRQYDIPGDDEARATPAGWVARRWDPAVRQRFHKLLFALGRELDGKIEGINLPETAVDFGESGRLFPSDFSARQFGPPPGVSKRSGLSCWRCDLPARRFSLPR